MKQATATFSAYTDKVRIQYTDDFSIETIQAPSRQDLAAWALANDVEIVGIGVSMSINFGDLK